MNAMKLSYILAAGALMVSAIGQAQVNQFMKVSTTEGTYLYDATDATKGTVVGNFTKFTAAPCSAPPSRQSRMSMLRPNR